MPWECEDERHIYEKFVYYVTPIRPFTYEYPGLSFCDYHRCQYEEYVKYPNLPVSSESILTYPSLLLAYCVG